MIKDSGLLLLLPCDTFLHTLLKLQEHFRWKFALTLVRRFEHWMRKHVAAAVTVLAGWYKFEITPSGVGWTSG